MEQSGYVMLNKRQPLDMPHVYMVLKELGRFHALSFAFKDQDPQKFIALKSSIAETVFNLSSEAEYFIQIITNAWNAALKIARKSFEREEMDKIEEFL
ncbi:hypothetical protein ANN_25204 [Periplaneta americana]|uniref:Uncharacterized protein n=1 Tax=Periplaneta americana TaxID=6978 RepID=A0ABQ8S0N5_PERAM|nr:hypothetical protein ANN_25204 [Periplaneta americana]